MNNSTVCLLPTTRNSGEGEWVREPGWVSPAGTVHMPPPSGPIYHFHCGHCGKVYDGPTQPTACPTCGGPWSWGPSHPTKQLQARIAELEAGLRELQGTLLHDSKCLHVVYEGHCSCRYIKQAALITSLLESR